jgi:hypothetical protein
MTRKKIIADPETCASCRFFLLPDPKDDVGYCVRFPPKVIVINDAPESVLPVVRHDEWCGEYKHALQS